MAEGDVTLLVGRLTSYSEALERHTAAIQRAFEKVQDSYANLRRVYGGAAADDVHAHWRVTTEALERYLEGSRRIKETLDARLASLREADLPMGGGAMRHRSLAPPQQGAGLRVALRADTSHVFRSAPGHVPDTPQNRALIAGAVRPQNLVGTNRWGISTYRQLLPDGRQVWVEVRGATITNGGINNAPRP